MPRKPSAKPKRRNRPPANARTEAPEVPQDEAVVPLDPNRPPWIPAGVELERVPPQVLRAVEQVVLPAYRDLVLEAADPLERSLGTTLVHLLWLEIVQQHELSREYYAFSVVLDLPMNTRGMIAEHLHLIDSKIRAGSFLLRLREIRARLGRSAGSMPPVLPPPDDHPRPASVPSVPPAPAIDAEVTEPASPPSQEANCGNFDIA